MLSPDNIKIRYLRRARRGTIRILPDGSIRVTVPFGVAIESVNKFLLEKANWIEEKQKKLKKIQDIRKFQVIDGEFFEIYGERLQLKTIIGRGSAVLHENKLLLPVPLNKTHPEEYMNKLFIDWCKTQALKKIRERVEYYSRSLGLVPKSISMKNYKSRWGACSSKGDLIFNWQIIFFKPEHFDYVVAHELCHLKEMNHSERFYRMLDVLGFSKKKIHAEMRYLRNLI